MELQVNQKVWKIQINKVINAKSDLYKNGVTINEHKIIGKSEYKICINTDHFTTFNYVKDGGKKDKYGDYIDTVCISIKTKEDYFGNGIFSTLYSTKKPSKPILKRIVREISLKIDKEYGFLFNGFKSELDNFVNNYKF